MIKSIPLFNRNRADSWYWGLDKDGEFSVRSCYRKLRGENDYANRSFWTKLWNIKLPGKILNFLWRACFNVLPTAETLVVKHVNVQRVCSWCHLCHEDTIHVLFTCCFALELWQSVGLHDIIPAVGVGSVLQVMSQY